MADDRYWPDECPSCGRQDSIRVDGRGAWLCAACGCWQTQDDDEPQGVDGVNWPTRNGTQR
jgi:ribosomal protein L37AE/L43A